MWPAKGKGKSKGKSKGKKPAPPVNRNPRAMQPFGGPPGLQVAPLRPQGIR